MNEKAVSGILLALLLLIGMLTLTFNSQAVRASGTICNRVGGTYDIAVNNTGAARLRIPDPLFGMMVPVFVVVENQGSSPIETDVEVNAFYDTTLIGTTTVYADWYDPIYPGDQRVVSINWDLEPLPNGVYTISANASVLPGETNTANNFFVNGDVLKTIFADVTGDGLVDLFDLFTLSKAHNATTHFADLNSDGIVNMTDAYIMWAAAGSTSESSNWNPYADLDGDGYIGSSDSGVLGASIGITGDPHWNLHADMNADNAIDLSDLRDLSNNYGAIAP
jgi:hypothetical protein